MLNLLFLLTALTRLCSSENILSRLRDDVFYQYDAEVIPQEVSGGRLECLLTVYLLRTGRTASLLMSTWVWPPPGWTWTATVEILFSSFYFVTKKPTQGSCLSQCGWKCRGETTDWPGILSTTLVSTSSGEARSGDAALLSNSFHRPESPLIPCGSLTLHFSIRELVI